MKKIILWSFLLLGLVSCKRFFNKENTQAQEERIVCISKQYSEIIFALEAEQDLVAVDLSSTYPPEIKNLPSIGYHRALSAEAVLAMHPTLIIHDNNIGPEYVVDQLNQLQIPMKVFDTKAEDLETTEALIKEMGGYFHQEAKAEELVQKLREDMALALKNKEQYEGLALPKVLIIHFGRANNVYLVVSGEGSAAKMIRWAGGEIAVDPEKGMKQLSAEVVAESNPDIILLTDFGYDQLASLDKIKELPGVGATKAAQEDKIYRVEEHDLIYLGPRTGENVLLLQKLLHGEN
ncbi:MAG: ABC transporter substrate-binding protein [Bacteroidetes bacterium]|nr:ABC transporter substrate-binding protein [Bacteroidota bacterium]